MGTKSEEAFRKDYSRLGELRSLVHHYVPFITLTATATETVRRTIIRDLGMDGCLKILGDPSKTNVRYAAVDIDSTNLYGSFSVIIKDVEINQINATKEHVAKKSMSRNFLNYSVNALAKRPITDQLGKNQ